MLRMTSYDEVDNAFHLEKNAKSKKYACDEYDYYIRTDEFYLDMQDELKYHEAKKKTTKAFQKR